MNLNLKLMERSLDLACSAMGKEWREDDDDNAASWITVELTVSYAVRVRQCKQCWKAKCAISFGINSLCLFLLVFILQPILLNSLVA